MKPKYAAFSALDPFFEVVQRELFWPRGCEHYFDTIAKNAIVEFRYDIARWPKRVEGRDALMALYRGSGESIVLHGGDGLVVHRCDDGRVIVIEYEVHRRVVGSGAARAIPGARQQATGAAAQKGGPASNMLDVQPRATLIDSGEERSHPARRHQRLPTLGSIRDPWHSHSHSRQASGHARDILSGDGGGLTGAGSRA